MNLFDAAAHSMIILGSAGFIFVITIAVFLVISLSTDEVEKWTKDLDRSDDI